MTRKTYRTAQGKIVDLGALQLQNEQVRAVGNMSVNARGDLIDGLNRPIDSRNRQVAKQYGKQTVTNVSDGPVESTGPKNSKPKIKKVKPAPGVEAPPAPEDFQDDFVKPTAPDASSGGLAAAIARARQIRQELVQTPDQKPGLTRI